MRVISGDYKGKKILEPKDIETRPLKDLTKESIFNILKHSKKFLMSLFNFINTCFKLFNLVLDYSQMKMNLNTIVNTILLTCKLFILILFT